MHPQVRKAIKTRGTFPDEQAATKLIWLAIDRAERKWRRATTGHARSQRSRSTSKTDSPD
jgi:transposase-like protein